jgi:para-aminobenzoate synthetase component 1
MRVLDKLRGAKLRRTPLDGPKDPWPLISAIADQPGPVVLESAARHHLYGRCTLLACRPLMRVELRDGHLRDDDGRTLATLDDDLWQTLAEILDGGNVPDLQADHYAPGWVGYLGYELGRTIERLPARARRDTALPDLHLAFYDALLTYDPQDAGWQLVEILFDDPPPHAGQAAQTLRQLLSEAPNTDAPRAEASSPAAQLDATSNFHPDAYRQAVQRCIDYIAAGDIFQVNLSQRFCVPNAPPAIDIYRTLRRRNPACYAAYLDIPTPQGRASVVSSSPELFLRVTGRDVLTRPIKGTRPRTDEADHDATAAAELQASEKDNAELAMIIDLLRNDLGRVCDFGTVRVQQRAELEEHPTVYHLVGTVVGRLREGVGQGELLRATFPGGSITGAPKIRAMEIIDELEGLARGVYTGAIGMVGVNGRAEWNIAIRTIVCDAGRALVQAGGGIVADSTPDGEYQETLAKARALLEAIAMAGH